MIDKFEGQYDFLSNFYPSPFEWHGVNYPTVEHFFQAAKANTQEDFNMVMREPNPGGAKHAGRNVELRPDWEEIKDKVMYTALKEKFAIPELRKKLLDTDNEYLVEGNTWHDNYWGVCRCSRCDTTKTGKNHLGLILMKVREEIKNDA